MNGIGLNLPSEVRWNTMCGSLESYIKNWPIFMPVVEESMDVIGSNIKSKEMNMSIKQNVENLLLC